MKGESFASYGKTFEDTSFITLSYYCCYFLLLLFLDFYHHKILVWEKGTHPPFVNLAKKRRWSNILTQIQKVSAQIWRLCKIGRKLKFRGRQSKQFQWFVSDHWVSPPSPRFWNPIFQNPFIWNCFVCKICFYPRGSFYPRGKSKMLLLIFCWIRDTINRNVLLIRDTHIH